MLAASVVSGGERQGPPLWALVLRIVAGLGLILSAIPLEEWTLAVVGGLTGFGGILHYLAISRHRATAALEEAERKEVAEEDRPVRTPPRTLAGRLKSRLGSLSGFSRWG